MPDQSTLLVQKRVEIDRNLPHESTLLVQKRVEKDLNLPQESTTVNKLCARHPCPEDSVFEMPYLLLHIAYGPSMYCVPHTYLP